jgi:hypothetical protein
MYLYTVMITKRFTFCLFFSFDSRLTRENRPRLYGNRLQVVCYSSTRRLYVSVLIYGTRLNAPLDRLGIQDLGALARYPRRRCPGPSVRSPKILPLFKQSQFTHGLTAEDPSALDDTQLTPAHTPNEPLWILLVQFVVRGRALLRG